MFKHKSGAQKRKERLERDKIVKQELKKHKTLFGYDFGPTNSSKRDDDETLISKL